MLNPRLRLRHLQSFMEIARLGSLSAAAHSLHVSQPAVSKTIRELEEIIGAQLFDRSGRGLALTAAGRLYQHHVGAALNDLENAQRNLAEPQRERVKISVGVLPTAATGLVPHAALAFRQEQPDVLIDVMTGPNWLLHSLLREGQLDVVVGRMPPANGAEGLHFQTLYWERVVPVVRVGHPLLAGSDWPYHALSGYALMLPPPGALISVGVRTWLHSVGIPDPRPAFENVSLAFGREVVQKSDTVWFISEGVVRPEIDMGLLAVLPIRNELLGGQVGVTLRSGREPTLAVARLIAALEQAAIGMA